MIARHPQLNLLESTVRYDTELLADVWHFFIIPAIADFDEYRLLIKSLSIQAIRNDLERIDASTVTKPTFDDIRACDLGIWVTQAKGPSLHPGKGKQLAEAGYSWETEDEDVLFQRYIYSIFVSIALTVKSRFGHYQPNEFGTATPCVILFVAHKKDRAAHIILRDQSWITLATFIGKDRESIGHDCFVDSHLVGKITARPVENFVHIGDQRIECSTAEGMVLGW